MIKKVLLLTLTATLLLAAPAFQGKRTFTQADGSSFQARAQGDEYLNWIEAEDGSILRYNLKTKNYEYAEIRDNNLQKSGRIYLKDGAAKSSKRGSSPFKITREDLGKLSQERRKMRHSKPVKSSYR